MKGFFRFLLFIGIAFAALMAFSESFREHFYMHLDYLRDYFPCNCGGTCDSGDCNCDCDCDCIIIDENEEEVSEDDKNKEVAKKGEELKEVVKESAKDTKVNDK